MSTEPIANCVTCAGVTWPISGCVIWPIFCAKVIRASRRATSASIASLRPMALSILGQSRSSVRCVGSTAQPQSPSAMARTLKQVRQFFMAR